MKKKELTEDDKRNLAAAEAKRKRRATTLAEVSVQYKPVAATNSKGKSFRPKRGPSKGSLARWNLQRVRDKRTGEIQNVPIRDRKTRRKAANV